MNNEEKGKIRAALGNYKYNQNFDSITSKRKRSLRKFTRRCEDSSVIYLGEVRCKIATWTHFAQDTMTHYVTAHWFS